MEDRGKGGGKASGYNVGCRRKSKTFNVRTNGSSAESELSRGEEDADDFLFLRCEFTREERR